MATPRMTHIQRERAVLNDLEASFPDFTGRALVWTEVQANHDPPDFISRDQSGPVGLELVEWLNGDQMTPAKTREARREHVQRVLTDGWENEYQPRNFRGAYPSLSDTGRAARGRAAVAPGILRLRRRCGSRLVDGSRALGIL